MKLFLQWFAVTVAMLFVRGEAMAQSPYYVAYNVSGSDFADGNMRFPARPATLVSTDDQGFSTYTFTIPAGTRDQAQFLILTGEATGWKQSYTEIKRYHSGQDTGNFEISSDPQVLYRYGNNSTTGYLYINDAARKEHTLTIRESVAGTQNVVEVSVSSAPAEPVAEGTVYDDMYVTFRVENTAAWELARPMAKTADGWEFTFPEAREKAEFMVSHRNDYNSPSNMLNGWWYVQFSAGDKDSAEPYDMSDLNGSNLSLFPQNCNHYLLIDKPGTHTVRIKPVAESSYFMVGNGVYEQVADMKFSYTTVAPERLDVFLPLSKSDFYNDDHTRRRHYFLVGTRQGEWRLQPEWELHPDAEGRLGIFVPRVMYTGLVGVGMVDNYDDYSNGRFTLFTTPGGVRYDTESSSAILGDGRDFDFYAEDAEGSDGLRPDQDMAAVLMASQGYTDYNNGSVGYSNGMLADEIVVELAPDGVTPRSLDFRWSARPYDDVSKYITFSLVGGGIINEGLGHASNTVVGRHDWQDAYVQYDPGTARPYRDAHGMLLYQTCFQTDWMLEHPSFFNKKIGDSDFNYTSQSLQLENVDLLRGKPEYEDDPYRSLYERFDADGGAGTMGMVDGALQHVEAGDFSYNEFMRQHGHAAGAGDNKAASEMVYDNSRTGNSWKCFIVKDMWMDGYFKIWTGWGGGRKQADKVELADPQNSRWNNINGGHGHQKCHVGTGSGPYPYGCDRQPDDDPFNAGARDEIRGFDITRQGENAGVYPLFMNIDGGDFFIKDLTYFKRVIVWYDPEKGLNNSVVQLLVERGGPAIKAMKGVLGSEINYVWNVPDPYGNLSEQEKLREVSRYTVDRYVYDRAGGNWTKQPEVVSEPLSGVTVADLMSEDADTRHPIQAAAETGLEAGTYRYRVTLSFADGSQELYALSNRVTLYEAEQPVKAEASQRMGTGDEEGAYSFDVVLRLDLSNAAYSEVFDDGSQLFRTTDLVKSYLLKVDEATATALNAATAGPKFTFGTRRVYVDGDMEGQDVEGWFADVEFPAGNELATKTVQWDNVVKADNYYPFTIYLEPADNSINLFAQAAFGTSSAGMEMVVPEVSLVWVKDAVEKADESLVPEFTAPEEMPMGTHLGSPSEIDLPVHYSRANTLCSYYELASQGG